MKYPYSPEEMDSAERQSVNEALVYLVRTGALSEHSVSHSELYNGYTGKGGLHGLDFKDFPSFAAYTAAKKEYEHGEFFTPHDLARVVVENLDITPTESVLDPTCGAGVFFNFVPVESNAHGVELDAGNALVAQELYPNASIVRRDVREWSPKQFYHVAVCNPPFNLDFSGTPSQQFVVSLLGQAMRPGGLVALIVPSSYSRDEYATRDRRALNENFSFLGEWGVPSDTFSTADIDIKVMLLARQSAHLPTFPYEGGQAPVVPLEVMGESIAKAVKAHRARVAGKRANIEREASGVESSYDADFQFRATKLLYDISTLGDQAKTDKARALLHEFATQKCPEGMEWEVWVQKRLTEGKVLARLRQMLRPKRPEVHKVSLVRRPGGLQWKGYSTRTRKGLDRTIYRLTDPECPTAGYERLVRRKNALYDLLALPYEDISEDMLNPILKHLDTHPLVSPERGTITLRSLQRLDTARMLCKPYGYLQWDTGAGKTISAMLQARYRLPDVHNVFVVSTALAINNNLLPEFTEFGFPVRQVRSLRDVDSIEDGEVVFLTFAMLSKYRKQVRKHVKMRAQKVMLILDEADSISSLSAKRSQAVLSCFRRARYKLLMSATSTRNNVAESFSAFELLYNNCDAFLDESDFIYEERKTLDGIKIVELVNSHQGQPFAAYKKGLRQFKRAFSPSSSSVFGVQKQSQGVRNADQLQRFVNGSMLTRTFEDITGRHLVNMEQLHVDSSPEEEALYVSLVEEFEEYRTLYASTGVARKDAMMRIIQQLNALLLAPAYPQKFAPGVESSKVPALLDYAHARPDEWIAVGTTHVNVAASYARHLEQEFPDREVFLVTGASASLAQRRQVIADLKESGNGILVCTQQAFASSINIDFVDHVVLLEMQWNFAAMKQFFTRFARFTSQNEKTITFLLNRTSIETNLMRLLIEKEEMNAFMRGDMQNFEEIALGLGLDDDFFDKLLAVDHDAHGSRSLSWHDTAQKIA